MEWQIFNVDYFSCDFNKIYVLCLLSLLYINAEIVGWQIFND
jgi:hypothetical protein